MPRNDDLLEQLVQHLIKKTDDHNVILNNKIDSKVDNLQDRVCEEIHNLRKEVTSRIDVLESRLESHEQRLHKVEHKWATLTFFISAGAAVLVSAFEWLGHLFGVK